jgi:hypothetical protein
MAIVVSPLGMGWQIVFGGAAFQCHRHRPGFALYLGGQLSASGNSKEPGILI